MRPAIAFPVEIDKGEIPFRNYHSSQGVGGFMYVIVSKLDANDDVMFHLYQLNSKTGDKLLAAKTVTLQEFKDLIKVLEADLQKQEPAVKIVEARGGAIALAENANGDMIGMGLPSDVASGLAKAKGAMPNRPFTGAPAQSGPTLGDTEVGQNNQTTQPSSRLSRFMK